MVASDNKLYRNQLEPSALIRQFAVHPPEGFVVPGFWTAFWGALLYSLLTWLVSLARSDRDD